MKYYGLTDRGLVRKTNQDNYLISTNKSGEVFALVCDGIGGALAGDVASKMAIDYFSEVFSHTESFKDLETIKSWIRYHITQCNEKIYIKGSQSNVYRGMGTTLSGVFIGKCGKLVVNIGDSRVYGVENHAFFKKLTHDHTIAQDMLKQGEITEKEAANHPKKHVLTNALGVWSNVRCDIEQIRESVHEVLICSDGLHGYVETSKIEEIVLNSELTITMKVRRLLKSALNVGGYDNITIIMIEMGDEVYER